MDKTKKTCMIIAIVEAVVAIFMWVAVTKIAPACGGMLELASGKQVHMKCYYTGVVFGFVAFLLLINAVLSAVKPGVACGVMAVVIAMVIFAVLNDAIGIGICANTDMACQMMAPYAKVCSVVEMICGLIYTYTALKEEK